MQAPKGLKFPVRCEEVAMNAIGFFDDQHSEAAEPFMTIVTEEDELSKGHFEIAEFVVEAMNRATGR